MSSRLPDTAGTTDQLPYWLALLRAPGIGPCRFRALLECCGQASTIFQQSRHSLEAIGIGAAAIDWIIRPDWRLVETDLAWLNHEHHQCLSWCDPAYPSRLREIPDPPPLLFVAGDPAVLSCRQIAMVGSRNPSPGGETLAHDFARALIAADCAITSGLALGIDTASHRGALDAGGITIAVAGTGPDLVYPARNRRLAEMIVKHRGALVSEFPCGTLPKAGNFPRRNRIISGLSLGTLVVEAALRSGSLITARLAMEQGREVFALPGSVQNPLSRGCHSLIKQGAKLVETVSDILEEINGCGAPLPAAPSKPAEAADLPADYRELLKYIAYDPTSVDTLVAATGSTPDAISSMLLLLELQGYVISVNGRYSRVK